MNRILLIITILFATLLTACNSREKQLEHLNDLSLQVDTMLFTHEVLTVRQRDVADELIDDYNEYAKKYPEDSLTPQFLMKSALLSHVLGNFKEEITTLEMIIEKYPNTEYAPQALATAARVSEENLNDMNKSKEYLTQIKEKYPDSPYAVNIDLQIEYVGDTDGLLNAIMAKKGVDLDSLLAAPDSVDTVKKRSTE